MTPPLVTKPSNKAASNILHEERAGEAGVNSVVVFPNSIYRLLVATVSSLNSSSFMKSAQAKQVSSYNVK